ncbi:uncharacterized protein CLUP02_11849 [Colletotrichum lupini]|uniref:Uncharacterized protein n=1 Tax=Colletotrichum lupini TaxID=145971 RepID=A0A9Q8WK54_9PEZI|nr:uncharacterized protein CLUP02_11849 [Colletotrichum lupini]UQC86349.1 hypothetical protein CLUP02_11849 [Colletotrichum lupini]
MGTKKNPRETQLGFNPDFGGLRYLSNIRPPHTPRPPILQAVFMPSLPSFRSASSFYCNLFGNDSSLERERERENK